MFYLKLAWSNLRKSTQQYAPFMLASLVLFSINCSSLLILLSPIGKGMGTGAMTLGLGVFVLSGFALVMEVYSYNILLKQRSREFGLYNILGMNKRQVGLVASLELAIIYIFLMTLGSLFSAIFAKFLYLIFVNLIHYDKLDLSYSALPFITNIVIFTGIFVILEIAGLLQIAKASPLELFRKESQGEREPRGNTLLAALGIIALGVGYYLALTSSKIAALAVIIRFFIAVVCVIVGTYLFYISFMSWYLKKRRQNKTYFYTPEHFVSTSQMIYRMKQNAVGLASITILAVMSLVTIGTTMSLYSNIQTIIDSQFLKNTSITFDISEYGKQTDLLHTVTDKVGKKKMLTYTTSLISLPYESSSHTIKVTKDSLLNPTMTSAAFTYIINQDDFKALGNDIPQLDDNQALFASQKGDSQIKNISILGTKLSIVKNLTKVTFPSFLSTYNATILVVANDDVANTIRNAYLPYLDTITSIGLTYNIQMDLTDEERSALSPDGFNIQDSQGNIIGSMNSRQDFTDDALALFGGFLFTGMLLGLSFLLGAALIIYYKQYSEGHEDKRSYKILQEVGMGEQQVKKVINSQIILLFFMPLAMAGLDYLIAIPMLKQMLTFFGVTSSNLVYLYSAVTIVTVGLIYFVIYKATSRTYYKIIER